jgi:quinoprotein dehydrogenase-associated probable ABC transporter substrate-binding protein
VHALTDTMLGDRRWATSFTAIAFAACGSSNPAPKPEPLTALRVCADPNNLPFSNRQGKGFENELATLIAHDLGVPVTYTWLPQRRGFIRNTLKAKACDVVMGEPVGFELARVTRPYYRSTYAFVTRADRKLELRSFDDPQLAKLRIGVHAVGDDYANVPPAMALARRGLQDHIVGYSIYGDYSQPDPPRDLIDAVARGDIDAAIAWGPLAGYFARHSSVPLVVTPIESNEPGMSFAIGLAVRRDDKALAATLEGVLDRERPAVDQLLDRYGVPRLSLL